MYFALIFYILLWGAMVILYGFDYFIIIGGLLILIGTIIAIFKAKEDTNLADKYDNEKKKRKNRKS